jgi:hypothetical protein
MESAMLTLRSSLVAALLASASAVALIAPQAAQAQSTPGQQTWTQSPQPGSTAPGSQFSNVPGSVGMGMPSEQQVRGFFQQVEQIANTSARTGNRMQAFNFIRAHLEPDAEFWSTSELYVGGRHVASTLVNVNEDTLSSMLGFAASAMHGRDNVRNYNISINVRTLEPTRRGTVRVTTTMNETGQILSAAQGPLAQYQGQGQFASQQAFAGQGQGFGQGGGAGGPVGSQGGPAFSGSQQPPGASGVVNFNTQAICTHELSLGSQGQVEIGNSRCRSRVDIVG